MAQATTISQLPLQLLARILAMLKPSERLGSAAVVATAWRSAAALATDRVRLDVPRLSEAVPQQFDSLSAWLANNSVAGITEIYVTTPMPTDVLVQLPVLQLPSLERLSRLECLHCYGLAITAAQGSSDSTQAGAQQTEAAAAEAAVAAAFQPLELAAGTALTALQFYSCNVTVRGLAALTRLQSLTLGAQLSFHLPDAVTANHSTQLQQALPQLQALSFLRMFGVVANDDVLQHVSSLPRLQELVLMNGMFTLASFQQLPQSLTSLSIDWADDSATSHALTASTAPGLYQLTGLQELEVQSGGVSLELLANLTSLKSLDCAAQGDLVLPGRLSQLTALTQLTRVALPLLGPEVLQSEADAAAITASPQLVELDIGDAYLQAQELQHIFAAGRQLTRLTKLRANLDLIHDGRAARVAACCPNLATIILASSQGRWVVDVDEVVTTNLATMLPCWQRLQHLTSLTFGVQDLPMMPEVWRALARVTQLQELHVSFNDLGFLQGVLHLTSCTRLRRLCVDARSFVGLMDRVWLDVTGDQAEDGTTTLPQQLPKALQQAILQQVREEEASPELLGVVLRCGAEIQQAQEQQLAQQQGEIAQLRRDLRGVQASLAAVLQQLGQAVPRASE